MLLILTKFNDFIGITGHIAFTLKQLMGSVNNFILTKNVGPLIMFNNDIVGVSK